MPIGYSLDAGKAQVEATKGLLEIEQERLAQKVCEALNKDGFECELKQDGMQRVRAGLIPVKISKLKIVPLKELSSESYLDFQEKKDEYTDIFAQERQKEYKKEQKRLKKGM